MVIDAATKYLRGICHDCFDSLSGDNYLVRVEDCVPVLEQYARDGRTFDYVINDLTDIPISQEPTDNHLDLPQKILDLSLKVLKTSGKYWTHGANTNDVPQKFEEQLKHLMQPVDFLKEVIAIPSYHELYPFLDVIRNAAVQARLPTATINNNNNTTTESTDNGVNISGQQLFLTPCESGPLESYQNAVDVGYLSRDPHQLTVIQELQKLHEVLSRSQKDGSVGYRPHQQSYLGKLFGLRHKQGAPNGLYLYGNVGSGKSMLMDLFYTHVSVTKKKRVHFHAFMLDVHARIHRQKKLMPARVEGSRRSQAYDPIPPVAEEISDETWLLCFDEFQDCFFLVCSAT
uniref:PABS domain-containing protein n=1 Tax=Branchiostoma floridae TaxID=7739 RepID=C3ZXB2_BRAFL|eukprot:XP_002586781.1 hypothetical protein BRAFLDRAFT_102939 [Branchiostoma floridae]